jgi:hypothetical protein
MSDPRITAVLDNLTSLIVSHAGLTAVEQYMPSQNPDDSDDVIKEHQKWVKELRDIRERFENLVTGILP